MREVKVKAKRASVGMTRAVVLDATPLFAPGDVGEPGEAVGEPRL